MSERRKLLDAFTKSHNEQGMFVAKLYDLIGEQRERAEEAEAENKLLTLKLSACRDKHSALAKRYRELEQER